MAADALAGSVRRTRHGAVLVATLDRPSVRNALDAATLDALLDLWRDVTADPEVRGVVLTGAGRAFSAGADLAEPPRTPEEIADNQRRRYNANATAMAELPVPIVAAVNGPAVGAGLALAALADVRIAAATATFLPGFAALGATPDAGASWSIPRLIGPGRAFDWLTSGRSLDAVQALEWGLVSEVVAPDALHARALERAGELASVPGRAVALTKALLQAGTDDLAAQLEAEIVAQVDAADHPDRARARSAAQRRGPDAAPAGASR